MSAWLLLIAGCGPSGDVDPLETPQGKLCLAAYDASVATVADMFARRGSPPLARWPDRNAYVERCLALELTEVQYGCVDPVTAQERPKTCSEQLAPVKADVDRLTGWFNDELRSAHRRNGEDDEGEPP